MTIKIIKNVLSEYTHKNILSQVEAETVCWSRGLVLDENISDYQFSHPIYEYHNVRSHLFDVFNPLFEKLKIVAYSRIKLNCNIQQHENRILGGFHTDNHDDNGKPRSNFMTAIYYLNDTNGKTLIKENKEIKEIKCIANSVVIFPNTLEHTGTTHTDVPFRYVLNLNYI